VVGVILVGVYAFISKGERLSTFTTSGTIVDVQTHQGSTGSSSYLIVKIPEVASNIRVSLPKNTAVRKGSSIEVACSKYSSGRILCRFVRGL